MTKLNIKILLIQRASEGKHNLCSSCRAPVKYDTLNQRWDHINKEPCVKARQPTTIIERPVFVQYYFDGENASKIAVSTTVKVNPMDFDNRSRYIEEYRVERDNLKTEIIQKLYQDILKAGRDIVNIPGANNAMWKEKVQNPERKIHTFKKEVFSIVESFDKAVINNFKISAGTRAAYTTTINAFLQFLQQTDIVAEKEPLATITMLHLEFFEQWQDEEYRADGAKRFNSASSIEARCKAVRTCIRIAQDITAIDPSLNESFRTKLDANIYHTVNDADLTKTKRPLTSTQVLLLINFIPQHHLSHVKNKEKLLMQLEITKRIMLFQLLTGLAPVDTANFRELDIVGERILKFRQKNRKGRKGVKRDVEPTPSTIILYKKIKEIIAWFNENRDKPYFNDYCKDGDKGFFPLPTLPIDQKLINVNKIQRVANILNRKYKQLAQHIPNFGEITPYMFRRSSATIMHCGGISLDGIAKHLGDKTTEIVKDHYVGNALYDYGDLYQTFFLEEDKLEIAKEAIAALTPEQRKALGLAA
jgi:integrase